MKRVVADTNILVSALQFGGKPKQLLDLATDGQVDLAIFDAIIAETLRILRDKFRRSPEWLVGGPSLSGEGPSLPRPFEQLRVLHRRPPGRRLYYERAGQQASACWRYQPQATRATRGPGAPEAPRGAREALDAAARSWRSPTGLPTEIPEGPFYKEHCLRRGLAKSCPCSRRASVLDGLVKRIQ